MDVTPDARRQGAHERAIAVSAGVLRRLADHQLAQRERGLWCWTDLSSSARELWDTSGPFPCGDAACPCTTVRAGCTALRAELSAEAASPAGLLMLTEHVVGASLAAANGTAHSLPDPTAHALALDALRSPARLVVALPPSTLEERRDADLGDRHTFLVDDALRWRDSCLALVPAALVTSRLLTRLRWRVPPHAAVMVGLTPSDAVLETTARLVADGTGLPDALALAAALES